MKKIQPGDIFELSLSMNEVGFLQFISKDSSQMDSDVVVVFKMKLNSSDQYDTSEIVNSEVLMFLHTMLNVAQKLNVARKIGNERVLESNTSPSFKCFNEKDSSGGLLSFLARDEWEVWEVNHDVKFIAKLDENQTKFDVGFIVPPKEIVKIIEAGKLTFSFA